MKKLLMLVLVLGLASLANAAPAFSLSSPNPFEITVTLIDTGVQALDIYIDYTPLLAYDIDPADAILTGSAPIVALNLQYMDPDGYNLYSLSFGSVTTLTPGVQGTLDINGAAENSGDTSVALDVLDMDGNSAGHIDVMIPEPATIALLCLGGLLLRKKK
jgi:hypothetical protein